MTDGESQGTDVRDGEPRVVLEKDVYEELLDLAAHEVELLRQLQQARARTLSLAPKVVAKAEHPDEPVNLLAIADGLGQGLSVKEIASAEPVLSNKELELQLHNYTNAVGDEAAKRRRAVAVALKLLAGVALKAADIAL